jgi:peptidoglycan/LPS O-acetylase OafA/YrhL
MAIHSSYLRGEVFDIGLSNVIGYALSPDRTSSDSYEHDVPHSRARQAAIRAHWWLWVSLAALLIGLSAAAVWSGPEQAALAFGVVPMWALLALSPYYYFVLALLPFMAIGLPRDQYRMLVAAVAVLLAVNLAIWNGSYISFSFGWHAVTQVLFAMFTLLVPLIPLLGDRTRNRTCC